MGVFSVSVEISDLERQRVERLTAWVDTGAFYTSVPRPLLESLGIEPHKRERFMLADGRTVESDIGHIWVRIGDRTAITFVLFAEPDSEPLLGAYTLEGLARSTSTSSINGSCRSPGSSSRSACPPENLDGPWPSHVFALASVTSPARVDEVCQSAPTCAHPGASPDASTRAGVRRP
jgi:predicted aspartyl protease